MKWSTFILLLLETLHFAVGKVKYNGYKVYDTTIDTHNDLEFLRLHQMNDKLDFWVLLKSIPSIARVMVPPDDQSSFEDSLRNQSIVFHISVHDAEKLFHDEDADDMLVLSKKVSGKITFDRYYRYNEISEYLDQISSEKFTVKSAAKSYEGREIKVITLTNGDGKKKNSIFIDAGIHAREWIAPATALYLINQLTDGNYTYLLDNVDIVIMPVANPDGYEYTFEKDRMWRKTRRPVKNCVGSDANRNFDDHHWAENGTSRQCYSDTYPGDHPFSETESQSIRNMLQELDTCKFYFTMHSFGEMILYPYGHTYNKPETWQDLDEVAKAGAEAIKTYKGTIYRYGSISNIIYPASGSSVDYAYTVAKIPIAIAIELPGGRYSFNPPTSEIKNISEESSIGIFAMIQKVIEMYP